MLHDDTTIELGVSFGMIKLVDLVVKGLRADGLVSDTAVFQLADIDGAELASSFENMTVHFKEVL